MAMTKTDLLQLQQQASQLTRRTAALYDTHHPASEAQFRQDWQELLTNFHSLNVLGQEEAKTQRLVAAEELIDDLTAVDFAQRADEVWTVVTHASKELMQIILPLREEITKRLEAKDYSVE